MVVKLGLLLLISCVGLIKGAPAIEQLDTAFPPYVSSRDAASDEEEAHYSLSRSSAECSVLRYESYLLAVEVYHSVPGICSQIYAKLLTLGVPSADVDALATEMATREADLQQTCLREMQFALDMYALLGNTNNDMIIEMDKLNNDLLLINAQALTLNITHQLVQTSINVHGSILSIRVERLIRRMTGPVVDEVRALVVDVQELLAWKFGYVQASKTAIDVSLDLTRTSLQVIIDGLPVA